MILDNLERMIQPPPSDAYPDDDYVVFDINADEFRTDEFRMNRFKVVRCPKQRPHDWTQCPFAHVGERATRRDPRLFSYSGSACAEFRRSATCSKGDQCTFAHGVFESWLHPTRYKTQMCSEPTCCRRTVCFFAHHPSELRRPNDTGHLHTMPPVGSDTSTPQESSLQAGAVPTNVNIAAIASAVERMLGDKKAASTSAPQPPAYTPAPPPGPPPMSSVPPAAGQGADAAVTAFLSSATLLQQSLPGVDLMQLLHSSMTPQSGPQSYSPEAAPWPAVGSGPCPRGAHGPLLHSLQARHGQTNANALRRNSWQGQIPSPPTEPPPPAADGPDCASAPLPALQHGYRCPSLGHAPCPGDHSGSSSGSFHGAARPFRSVSLPYPQQAENAAPPVDWGLTGSSFVDPPAHAAAPRRQRQLSGSGISDVSASSRHSQPAEFKAMLAAERAWASTALVMDHVDDSAGSKSSRGSATPPLRSASASLTNRDALLSALPRDLLQSQPDDFSRLADLTNVCAGGQ